MKHADLRARLVHVRGYARTSWIGVLALLGVAAPLTISMFQTCSAVRPERAPVVWTLVIDRASTVAAGELTARIDALSYDEDAVDLRLLERVKALDIADDVLPRKVAALQADRRKPADWDRLRGDILETLDEIARDYDAVLEATRARQLHTDVLHELAAVPGALANIRTEVDSHKSD